MQLKVKKRMDLVQYAVETMGRVSEETRGQAAVGAIQVLLRLSEGEVTPQELAESLKMDTEEVAESMEIFEEFGIVEVADPSVPSYTYLCYPEEIKVLLASKPKVREKFGEAVSDIESVIKGQQPQTPEEENDLRVLMSMVAEMRKDFDV